MSELVGSAGKRSRVLRDTPSRRWRGIRIAKVYCILRFRCIVAFMQPTRHCPSVDRRNCASRLTGASGRAICHEHPRLISGRIIRPPQF